MIEPSAETIRDTVRDLGRDGGFDCFLAGARTGSTGRVIGVDITAEIIRTARADTTRRGVTNVAFRPGEIEHRPITDGTADLVISHCVITLSPDQPADVSEAFLVLKPGGRLAFADIVAPTLLPAALRADLAARPRCIGEAAHVDAWRSMLADAGCSDARITCSASSRA